MDSGRVCTNMAAGHNSIALVSGVTFRTKMAPLLFFSDFISIIDGLVYMMGASQLNDVVLGRNSLPGGKQPGQKNFDTISFSGRIRRVASGPLHSAAITSMFHLRYS